MPEVDDVFVHVDPKELGEWKPDDDDADGLVGTALAGEGNTPPKQGAKGNAQPKRGFEEEDAPSEAATPEDPGQRN
jgi:hypothetical protein